ncbi:MAG TPA: hypothetical protein PK435_01950, partial [Thermoanaerobaculaceae bacterium]|nr:hypothetical protein [Thermoanaerobaculaceae bacterium]
GRIVGGIKLTSDFLTGGIFSYDGVHPQSLGYAIIANEWIKVINAGFGTKLPEVSLRPFLDGGGVVTTTSVLAANVVLSQAAAVAMVKAYAPYALTDKLEVGTRVIRRHIAEQPDRVPVGQINP